MPRAFCFDIPGMAAQLFGQWPVIASRLPNTLLCTTSDGMPAPFLIGGDIKDRAGGRHI
jgi:hypothetical protein